MDNLGSLPLLPQSPLSTPESQALQFLMALPCHRSLTIQGDST